MSQPKLTIIGGGLAGCEAAWQIARHGLPVVLHEMKPQRFSPAHHSDALAELVCSNSLRGAGLQNAVGCLKEELRRCGSLTLAAADATAVPAGGALAVDRDAFSACITESIAQHPLIDLQRGEVCKIPDEGTVIIASGPLTSDTLAAAIVERTGNDRLYFYDAIAPIIEADSIDLNIAWRASRYDKGGADYLNCPFSAEQYATFVRELLTAETVPYHNFEKAQHFEGCLPIEILAARGEQTLAFGPMKPVGLPDPKTGRIPAAVLQLRPEDRDGRLYNMVGFQTKLTHPEQKRLFRTIPGLEQAVFARLGSMHRNTFPNAPTCLNLHQQLHSDPRLFFAGQITGVEGYVESAASGFLAGVSAARGVLDQPLLAPPATTALGALLTHLTESDPAQFQPANVTYGLFPPLTERHRKRAERRLAQAERALTDIAVWWAQMAKDLS